MTRLVLCSGKVYFDLAQKRDASKDFSVHLARLEQLYPLPEEELKARAADVVPQLQEVFWVQEEPKNSGAWRYLLEPLMNHGDTQLPTKPDPASTLGRVPESASPATGFLSKPTSTSRSCSSTKPLSRGKAYIMSVEIKVPQLGESITEAVVGKWHKKVGDQVAVDEPVAVLETDKVTIDVQAPESGTLEAISFVEGSKVKIGDVLGIIDTAKAGAGDGETGCGTSWRLPFPARADHRGTAQQRPEHHARRAQRGGGQGRRPQRRFRARVQVAG